MSTVRPKSPKRMATNILPIELFFSDNKIKNETELIHPKMKRMYSI
jgi:hypothetical protein